MATPDDDTLECTLLSAPSSKKEAAGGAWWHSNAHTIVLRGAGTLGASELGRRAVAELRGGCVCGDGACTCTPPSEGTFGQEIGLSARIVVAGEGAGRRETLALVSGAELNVHLAAGDKPPFRVCDLIVFYDTAAQREGSAAPVNAMLADALRYAFGDDHALLRRPLRGNVVLAAELLSDSAELDPSGVLRPLGWNAACRLFDEATSARTSMIIARADAALRAEAEANAAPPVAPPADAAPPVPPVPPAEAAPRAEAEAAPPLPPAAAPAPPLPPAEKRAPKRKRRSATERLCDEAASFMRRRGRGRGRK